MCKIVFIDNNGDIVCEYHGFLNYEEAEAFALHCDCEFNIEYCECE